MRGKEASERIDKMERRINFSLKVKGKNLNFCAVLAARKWKTFDVLFRIIFFFSLEIHFKCNKLESEYFVTFDIYNGSLCLSLLIKTQLEIRI